MTITLTREEAQQVLDVFLKTREELRACQAVIHLSGDFDPAYVRGAKNVMALADAEIETLRARLAQPEPEPVAYKITGKLGHICSFYGAPDVRKGDYVYTAPPQREWHSLTDEEVWQIYCEAKEQKTEGWLFNARAIEHALKEKNK